MAIISWNKKYTETLAVTLDRFRVENPEYAVSKITYAGRLDPMADGLVILLTDDDVHKKDDFLGLDKVYEVDVIFGPKTDSYDILGLVLDSSQTLKNDIATQQLQSACTDLIGSKNQLYPIYSSKPVQGKPLFMWARENRLDEIKIPSKNVYVYDFLFKEKKNITTKNIFSDITNSILMVQGDFRQKLIIKSWNTFFKKQEVSSTVICTFKIHASSGTYVRSLVQALGEKIGIPTCSLKISRIQVGDFLLEND